MDGTCTGDALEAALQPRRLRYGLWIFVHELSRVSLICYASYDGNLEYLRLILQVFLRRGRRQTREAQADLMVDWIAPLVAATNDSTILLILVYRDSATLFTLILLLGHVLGALQARGGMTHDTAIFTVSVSGRRRLRAKSGHGTGPLMNDRHAHHSETNRLVKRLGLTLAKQNKTAQLISHRSRTATSLMQISYLHRQIRRRQFALVLGDGEQGNLHRLVVPIAVLLTQHLVLLLLSIGHLLTYLVVFELYGQETKRISDEYFADCIFVGGIRELHPCTRSFRQPEFHSRR